MEAARKRYLQEVYPRIAPSLAQRYPKLRVEPAGDLRPLSEIALLMLVALTGTGKSTALGRLRGCAGFAVDALPSRRDVADCIAIPMAQALDGAPLHPVADRVQRFAWTRRFAEQVPGGLAAAFSWLMLAPAPATLLVAEGIRGHKEMRYALQRCPRWKIIELTVPPLTRLRRLSARHEAFDRAAGSQDLSFLPGEQQARARQLLQSRAISPKALAIARAEAANYSLQPLPAGVANSQYQRLDLRDESPDAVAAAIRKIARSMDVEIGACPAS